MALIFLSHSSGNNAEAIGLRDWPDSPHRAEALRLKRALKGGIFTRRRVLLGAGVVAVAAALLTATMMVKLEHVRIAFPSSPAAGQTYTYRGGSSGGSAPNWGAPSPNWGWSIVSKAQASKAGGSRWSKAYKAISKRRIPVIGGSDAPDGVRDQFRGLTDPVGKLAGVEPFHAMLAEYSASPHVRSGVGGLVELARRHSDSKTPEKIVFGEMAGEPDTMMRAVLNIGTDPLRPGTHRVSRAYYVINTGFDADAMFQRYKDADEEVKEALHETSSYAVLMGYAELDKSGDMDKAQETTANLVALKQRILVVDAQAGVSGKRGVILSGTFSDALTDALEEENITERSQMVEWLRENISGAAAESPSDAMAEAASKYINEKKLPNSHLQTWAEHMIGDAGLDLSRFNRR